MAERLRYVNMASSAGGNGTTNATSGASRAYASSSEASTAEQANLVAAGDTLRVVCEGSTADSTALSISGYTTSATCFVTWETSAAGRHSGTLDTAKYRIVDNNSFGYCIDVQEDYCRFTGIQCLTIGSAGITFAGIQFRSIGAVGANQFYLDSMLFKATFTGTADGQAIYGSGTNSNIGCKSTLFYDWVRSTAACYAALNTGSGVWRFHNCTCANMWRALRNSIITNCIGQGADTGSVFLGNTANYCASNDASLSGGTGNRNSQTFTFVNEAGDDYHLSASDTGAYHLGTDLTADANLAVTLDIDGQTIATTFDIGSDWVMAAGSSDTFPVPRYRGSMFTTLIRM